MNYKVGPSLKLTIYRKTKPNQATQSIHTTKIVIAHNLWSPGGDRDMTE
jgi:hypothetical protein